MNEQEKQFAITEIAITKAYTYMQEYNPYTGKAEDKQGASLLKQGYVDGFLAGVAFRLTGGMND